MEEVKTNAGQGLGIAGLILGCVAIPLAILGCTSILGLILGATGIILSAVGLSQATKSNGNKGLPTGGLIVSILGTCIALMWLLFFAHIATEGGKWWSKEGVKIIKNISDEIDDDLEEAFEELGEELEQFGEELEDKLEDLEYDIVLEELWGEEITEEEFDKVLDAYESLIKNYLVLVEESEKGNIDALSEYVNVSAKAVALATKITAIGPNLSEEQRQKFEDLQKKYEQAIEETNE